MAFVQAYSSFLDIVSNALDLAAKTADKSSSININSKELRDMIIKGARVLLRETEIDKEFLNLKGIISHLIKSADNGDIPEVIADMLDIRGDIAKIVTTLKDNSIDLGAITLKATSIANKAVSFVEQYGASFFEAFDDFLKGMHVNAIELREKVQGHIKATEEIDCQLKSALHVIHKTTGSSVQFLKNSLKVTAIMLKGFASLSGDKEDQIICEAKVDEMGNVLELTPCDSLGLDNELATEFA